MSPQHAAADIPRTIGALILVSALAPVLFMTLALFLAAIVTGQSHSSIYDIFGMGMFAVILGAPASVGAALVAGMPGIYLARQMRLTSPWFFGLGGTLLALGCTAWFARNDVRGLADLTEFASIAALTGAICGLMVWFIAERSRP